MVELLSGNRQKLIKLGFSANFGFIEIFDFDKFLIVPKSLGFFWALEVAERVPVKSKFLRREVVLIISPLLFHFLVENFDVASTVYGFT